MNPPPKIYVAGHRGMVGSAIVRQLLAQGHPADHIVTRTHAELDLTDQASVRAFFETEKPDQVYLAASKSAATISAHISLAVISGTHPSFCLALLRSPSSVSTSVGRKYRGSMRTTGFSFQ